VLFGSKELQQIIKIKKKKNVEYATTPDVVSVVLETINKYNLQVSDFTTDKLGNFIIKTFPSFDKLSINDDAFIYGDECFYKNIIFMSDLNSYKVIPSTVRVKCLNQLTSADLHDGISFEDISTESLKKLNSNLDTLKKNDFVSKNFIRQVKRAYTTPASYNEYLRVIENIKHNSNIDNSNLDYYFDYTENTKKIHNFCDKESIELCQSINCKIPTNKTVWELINGATYFASNSKQDEINDGQRLVISNSCGNFINGDRNGFFDLFFQL
jgi:hypothetical protein